MTLPLGTPSSRVKANITKRQQLKKKWDKHCKYTAEELGGEELPKQLYISSEEREVDFSTKDEKGENWTRLLDEGVVVDGDGWAYAVIKKGVLKKAFDAIPSNFKGYIDKDHVRAIHLGYYGKKDLKLVELDNGRYAIDVNVHLDHELYTVKDLIREGRHHALSVEMYTDVDEFATAEKVTGDKEQGKWLVPLIDDLKIEGFAVCENPKNANSVNDGLLEHASVEEGNNMTEEEKQKLAAEEAAKKAELEATEGENADEDTQKEAVEEEQLQCTTETEDNKGEAGAGEGENAEEDKKTEASAKDAENDKLDELAAAIAQLKEDNAEKDKKIAELEAQLTAKTETKMSTEERIAKLLAEATTAKVSAAEGAEKMTAKDAEKQEADDIVAAYKAAFAE